MKTIIPIILTFFLAGCLGSQHNIKNWSAINSGPKPDLEKIKPLVMTYIKYNSFDTVVMQKNKGVLQFDTKTSKLKDPESAQFRAWSPLYKGILNWSQSVKITGVWQGCVQVNAKNSFGGYVGEKTYKYKVKNNKVLWMRRSNCKSSDYSTSDRLQ